MRTKIVYILCSDENDIFYEQALLSVFSLRKYNPDAFVELIVDQYTITTINGKRSKIKEYVNSIKVVEVPEKYNRRQLSRWIKTSLRNLIDGDYLFIDTDTIITDCLYDIDNFTGDIGAVKDQHTVVKKNSGKYIMLQWATQDGWSCFDDLLYFNSGVMYVRDCDFTHDFYKEWNKRWQNQEDIN